MTPQEAINILKNPNKQFAAKADGAYEYTDFVEAKKVAISALERLIPKKLIPTEEQNIRFAMNYICPSCKKHFTGTGIADYCYHCGQALDWSGV